MGDRTHVTLTLRHKDWKKAEKFNWFAHPEDCWGHTDGPSDSLVDLYYGECNYGDLDFEDNLIQEGIPFDKEWGHGGSYDSGMAHLRYNSEGEPKGISYEYGDERIPPEALLPLVDDHEKLVKFIKDFHSRFQLPPWEEQDKNIKIYLTKRLLIPG